MRYYFECVILSQQKYFISPFSSSHWLLQSLGFMENQSRVAHWSMSCPDRELEETCLALYSSSFHYCILSLHHNILVVEKHL